MDGSCIAQIFLSKKFSALAHTIHVNAHTDVNVIYPSPHTHTHIHTHHGLSRFVEMPVEKGKFWAGLWRQRGWGDSASWQAWIPDSWGNETERTVANRFEIAFRDFQVFHLMIGGCVKSDTCREKLKGKREVCRRSNGLCSVESVYLLLWWCCDLTM